MRLFARLTAALLVCGLAVLPAVTPAQAAGVTPPPAATAAATAGGGWLANQLSANGGFIKSVTGVASLSDTADAVLALHAAGVGKTAADAGLAWLRGNFSQAGTDPGLLAKLILVADAAGVPPRDFAGQPGTADDLVAALLATMRTTAPDAGLFGAGPPTFDGAFRQGLALLALAAAGTSATELTAPLGWLTNQQCASGAWMAYRADVAVPCPPSDPATFSGPDTNSAGLAVAALAAFGIAAPVDGLAWLAANAQPGGGWAIFPGTGAASDPNSTAVVLWAYNGRSAPAPAPAYASLLSFQLTSGPDTGAFWFDLGDGTRKPNVLATVQAVLAATGRGLPLGLSPIPGPPPSPSPSATATPTSTASASPSASPSASASASPTSSASASASPSATASPSPSVAQESPTPSPTTSAQPTSTPEVTVAGSSAEGASESDGLADSGTAAAGLLAVAGTAVVGGTLLLLTGRRKRRRAAE